MCAIFGIGFLKDHSFRNNNALHQFINNLMIESQVRGTDATGLAFVQESRIVTIKKNIPARRFSMLTSVKNTIKTYADVSKIDGPEQLKIILGHCRKETKGTHKDKNNNHPIITKKVIGVHNGMISNDEALYDNYRAVEYIDRKGKVDSEIIFQLIDYYSNHKEIGTKFGIKDTCSRIMGSYACAMINKKDSDVLWLFKATHPTCLVFYPKAGIVVFASDLDYIVNAVQKLGIHLSTDFGQYKLIEYPNHTGMGINMKTKKAHKFELYGTTERKPAVIKSGVFGL